MILGAHPSLTDWDLAPKVPAMLAPDLSVLHLSMAHASAVSGGMTHSACSPHPGLARPER